MYPSGWKNTGIYNSGSVSTAISTFARTLEAPTEFQICCEGAKYVLFTNLTQAGNLSGTTKFKIYGTQTSGESTQNVDFCFNTLLAEPQPNSESELISGIDIPNLPGLSSMKVWTGSTASFTNSGVLDDTSSQNQIEGIHFWNRISGNQTIAGYIDTDTEARSADAPGGDKYWVFVGKDDSAVYGPNWICIPAAPFNFIQLQMSSVNSANSTSILYNVLY